MGRAYIRSGRGDYLESGEDVIRFITFGGGE
jgi:hypothetical protein